MREIRNAAQHIVNKSSVCGEAGFMLYTSFLIRNNLMIFLFSNKNRTYAMLKMSYEAPRHALFINNNKNVHNISTLHTSCR